MSLISVRNFLSPFRSKAQIVSLLVAAILVIVVRFVSSRSGEARELSQGHLTDASARKAVQMEVKAFLDAQESEKMPGEPGGAGGFDPSSRDSIDDLLAARPSDMDRSASPPSDTNPKRFSDIRKSLGLE
jgi:hypothetical protein